MNRSRWLPFLAIGAFLSPLLPELAGARLLAFRDAFITHFPIQTFSLALERSGQVPFLNLGASNVEPLLANPNTVTLYPTHVLFHLFPPAAAFNLHLLLHVVWAFFGAAALSRRLGSGRRAAWIGGAAYAFSGPFLSYGAAFANAAAAAAWAPWAISEALRLGRAIRAGQTTRSGRAALAVGIALGLQILAGEPAVSAWTGVAVVACALAASRGSILRLAGAGIAAGATAAALAAPQVLSTAAAIPYSFRGEHLFSRAQFDAAANRPLRALETLFPLLFGEPRPLISGAFWGYRAFDSLQPYLYSMNFGLAGAILVVSALASRSFRGSRTVLALIAAAALFGLLSFGFRTPLFEILYAVKPLRHFRYPVKFALPAVLFGSVLVSLAAQEAIDVERAPRMLLNVSAAVAAALAATFGAIALAPQSLTRFLQPQLSALAAPPEAILSGVARTLRRDCLFGLAALVVLLLAASARRRTWRAGGILAAILLCLLPSGTRLFVSVPTSRYLARPPLADLVAGRGRLWVAPISEFAVAKFGTSHRFPNDDVSDLIVAGRQEIWPLTALPDGAAYAFDTDPDGSYGFLDRAMREALASAGAEASSRILRNASVAFYLSARPEPLPGYAPFARQQIFGRTLFLFQAADPVPAVRFAERVFSRSSLSGAIELVESSRFDPARDAILRGPDRDPPAASAAAQDVSAIRLTASGLSAEVNASATGVVVFAATYFRYWRAAVDGVRADVEIANGAFCGVRVPPGRHRVELVYDARPFLAGSLGSAAFLAVSLILAPVFAFRARKRRSLPSPAA